MAELIEAREKVIELAKKFLHAKTYEDSKRARARLLQATEELERVEGKM